MDEFVCVLSDLPTVITSLVLSFQEAKDKPKASGCKAFGVFFFTASVIHFSTLYLILYYIIFNNIWLYSPNQLSPSFFHHPPQKIMKGLPTAFIGSFHSNLHFMCTRIHVALYRTRVRQNRVMRTRWNACDLSALHIYTRTHTYMHVRAHTHTHIYTHARAHTHPCARAHTYTHTHTHTHARACTRIHTQTHSGFPCFMGTLYSRNGFYIVQTAFSIPLPQRYP